MHRYRSERATLLVLIQVYPCSAFIIFLLFLGPGAFIDVVAQASGRAPTVLGKPGEALRQLLLQRHAPIPASRVLFVGDSLASDVGFARASGYQTLLVLTGGSSAADVAKLPADHAHMPHYICDSLGDLCDPTSEK